MLEFGSWAMNGFCGAIVGSLILCALAGAPLNAGSDGVPTSTIGRAAASALRQRKEAPRSAKQVRIGLAGTISLSNKDSAAKYRRRA